MIVSTVFFSVLAGKIISSIDVSALIVRLSISLYRTGFKLRVLFIEPKTQALPVNQPHTIIH